MTWLWVALGAAVGAPVRFALAHVLDGRLPWGTVLVNAVGSLLLGWCSGRGLGGDVLALAGTGFCGALTTYSAFAVQAHERGPRLGTLTVLLTVPPCLLLAALGFWVGAQA